MKKNKLLKFFPILYLVFFLTFLLVPSLVEAEKLPMGASCENNDDCRSGDCEDSDLTTLDDDYCDCHNASSCAQEYGQNADETWDCIDDGPNDLDYCVSNQRGKMELDIKPKDGGQVFSEVDAIISKPTPRITIPGVDFSDIKTTEEADGTYLYIPFLGEYIASIYKYAIGAAAVLAIVMIMNNAIKWIISGGTPEKINEARKRIIQSVMGLLLIVGSYALLYRINPDLLEFKSLRILYIPTEHISEPFEDPPVGVNVDTISTTKVSCIDGASKKPYVYTTGDKQYFGLWECELTKNRKLDDIKAIVIHEGGRSVASTIGAWKYAYKKSGHPVGAHYIIERDGKIYQAIGEERWAYHANAANKTSIGIDLTIPKGCTQSPSKDGFYTCANYTAAQYSSLKNLIEQITARTSVKFDNNQIIGHCQVTNATHADPRNFEWEKIGLDTKLHRPGHQSKLSGCTKNYP